jgi:hypothetical protein
MEELAVEADRKAAASFPAAPKHRAPRALPGRAFGFPEYRVET